MAGFRKNAKIVVLVAIAVFALSQAIRIEKTNPPVRSDISAEPTVKALLKRACYNCHSNETVWPWYSNVAPVSWLVGSDVKEARQHVNFSEWGSYAEDMQGYKLKGIAEEVGGGDMPPWYYAMVHRDARLTPEERDEIVKWTDAMTSQTGGK